ncbi:hypothetical protein SIL78_02880 [Halomonas alkaliphila]|uniref:Uncharacterized protein n=1 Tax=Vreelandella alkaliphila TaxID=272774 RepID=A0AAJ2RY85_9GAMM|nr:hypothetical protein [Halomonas alkaliphila]MDX5976501.1 hypothetical protein [Halomonas alkaliphila]
MITPREVQIFNFDEGSIGHGLAGLDGRLAATALVYAGYALVS